MFFGILDAFFMSKRPLLSGLLVALLAAAFPAAAHGSSFEEASKFLAATGAISDADATDADEPITRGEAIKIMLDMREETRAQVERRRGGLSRLPLFLDVPPDDPIAPYAETAFVLRITSGFSDRTLRPSDAIPAEEAIALLMRAHRQGGELSDGDSEWYAQFVRAALRKNLIGDPRSMRVGQAITRGRFFDMAYRIGVLIRDNLDTFPWPVANAGPMRNERGPGAGAAAGASRHVAARPAENGRVVVASPANDQGTINGFRSSRDFAITIPSLGILDLAIAHPDDTQSKEGLLAPLRDGVGHLFSYPGRGGKIMIYGHSSGYAWDVSQYTKIFRQVNKLKEGDRVYVTFGGNLFEYAVTGQQTIAPADAGPFSGEGEELILYTCWPPKSIKKRLIVRATPVETVAVR